MKPIKLKIKGLNSFQNEQIIDFEKLTNRGLFGIFGPTGSGKSTILDGITLALYGKISRGNANYINTNSDDLNVSFDFEINSTNRYLVERSYKKHNDTKRLLHCKLIDLNQNIILEEGINNVNNKCIEIIGLSYDDFTRTVVLPQGKFSEFLKLKGTEKCNMLERLFNLNEYGEDLQFKLKKKVSYENQNLAVLNGKLSTFNNIDENILDEKKELSLQLENNLKSLEKELEIIYKEFKESEEIINLQSELNEKNNLLIKEQYFINDIKEKEEKVCLIKKSLKIEDTLINFNKTKNDKKEEENSLNKLKTEYATLSTKKEKLDKEFEELLVKYNSLSQIKNKIEKVQKIILLDADVQKLSDQIERYEEAYKTIVRDIKYYEAELENTIDIMNKKDSKINSLQNEYNKLSVNFDIMEAIQKGLILKNNISNLEENIKSKKINIEKIINKNNLLNEQLIEINEQKQINDKKIEKIHDEIKTYKINKIANIIRETLSKNEECPVCGSTHHKEIIYKEEEMINSKEEEIINKELSEKINNLKIEIESNKKTLASICTKSEEQNLTELISEFNKLKIDNNISDFEKENIEYIKIQKERVILDNNLNLKRGELQKLNISKEELIKNKEFEIKREQKGKDIITASTIEKELKSKHLDELKNSFEEVICFNKLLGDLKYELETTEEHFNKIKMQKEVIDSNYNQINSDLIKCNAIIQKLTIIEKDHLDKIEGLIKETDFENVEHVETILKSKNDLDSLKSQIDNFYKNITKLTGIIEDIKIKLNGRNIEVNNWEIIKNNKLSKENAQKELHEQYIKLNEELKLIAKNLEEINKLLEQKKEIDKQLGMLSDLEKLFKGKKFVEYIATNRLKYISVEASKKLKTITNGAYEIEVDENSNFSIIDNKNGGAKRDATTLSGGETFLASLALALSLSAEIQLKGTAPLEFFFLDEGFGTLDDDLLEVVIGSLEKLHNDKLKIGIISHVEIIKDRMPVKLMVSKSKLGASYVKIENN